MMKRIISVSRRTDIPAFYSDWFLKRLQEAYAGYVNRFGGQRHLVSLKPEDVLCFVFWSKNFEPFLEPLKLINEMGYQSIFHFTITGLPSVFETNLVETEVAIETLKILSVRYSPKHITWRYDPIVVSDVTDAAFHIENFRKIASSLEGYVERCHFSFPTLHGKVKRNLRRFFYDKGINIINPSIGAQITLANQLAEIAIERGIKLYTCCGDYLISNTIEKARCVDGELIKELFAIDCSGLKIKPTRKECKCTESTDIGAYDTCPHGCIYCYANLSKSMARKAYKSHDKNSAFLGYSKITSDQWISSYKSCSNLPRSSALRSQATGTMRSTTAEMQERQS